jgi:hypothetical protein
MLLGLHLVQWHDFMRLIVLEHFHKLHFFPVLLQLLIDAVGAFLAKNVAHGVLLQVVVLSA